MTEKGLGGFFENFLKKDSLFNQKAVLQASYTPGEIIHREKELNLLANILAPCLRLEKPSNVFLYGKTGTGKTLTAKYVSEHLKSIAQNKNLSIKIIHINCKLSKVADTEYRLVAQLARELGKEIPPTGLPTEEVYKIFYNAISTEKVQLLIVLDEIDQLVKRAGDEIIYNLTRINSELEHSQITLVGISNDLLFTDHLDPRVKSSLSEEEIVFPPYNALQLQDILRKRSERAFKEGVLTPGVVEKCAAYAAREHGDARRALELLRVAGEIAERDSQLKVTIDHIDGAEEKIEKDRVLDIVKTQPKQQQVTLHAILSFKKNNSIFTGDIYDSYKKTCARVGLRPLTQRRVSDIIGEMDMLGIINAKVISKGRFGRTREISLSIPATLVQKISSVLEQSIGL
ncbi:ORC1-type DNA replication protein [Candidatus Woesearchaeota archaeon]|jgi:archaeal cell division control protein 6|nr:ORC1-type DNA replication protein [Candidatus Woesearchaeota archaeon]